MLTSYLLDPEDEMCKASPSGNPKLRQKASRFQRSAETELETCYHRKPQDEFTGLAGGDPHWLETLANSWRKD